MRNETILLHYFIQRSLAAFASVSLSIVTPSAIVGLLQPNAYGQTTQGSSADSEIAFTLTVRNDKGGYIAGLKKESFNVLVNNKPQEISQLTRRDVPVTVGILIDSSGSIRGAEKRLGVKRLSAIRDGIAQFISLSNKENEYFLVGFAQQPELLLDNTRDGKAIPDKIASLELKGPTALFDACYMGIEKVARGTHRKRVLILISDGLDSSSKRQSKQLERLLKETDVLVYAISVSGIRENLFQPLQEFEAAIGNPVLVQFARNTGGVAFFPSEATQIKAMFEMIALDLQNQYTVVVRPKLSGRSDKWHSLKITGTPPVSSIELGRLFVRTREGFYPATGLR